MQDETTSSQTPQKSEAEKLQLTPKQLRFLCAYVMNGGNGTQAAIIAGYSPKIAAQIAHENLTKPDIQRALAEITHDEVYTTKRLLELMGAQALDADMADFWPFLAGEKTLPELEASGVNTKLVRKVTLHTRSRTHKTKDGGEVTTTDEVRGIELYDAQAAARDLLRMRAAAVLCADCMVHDAKHEWLVGGPAHSRDVCVGDVTRDWRGRGPTCICAASSPARRTP